MGQRIEQRGLPGVGVADQRDRRHRHRFPPRPLLGPHAAHIFDLLFHVADAPVNFPAIGFELRFARASGADAAAQLRHLDSAPAQPGQHVLQLRQFHLQLAFPGARMFRENVEDELGAVDHPGVDQLLDVALLRSGEVVIEQKQIGGDRSGGARDLFQLAASDQGGRIGTVAVLQKFADDLGARADRQRAQFGQRLFGAELGDVRGFRRQLCGGSVASRLGGRGQRTAPGLGRRRSARAGAQVKANEKRTLPGRTVPVSPPGRAPRRRLLPAGLTEDLDCGLLNLLDSSTGTGDQLWHSATTGFCQMLICQLPIASCRALILRSRKDAASAPLPRCSRGAR